MSTPEVEVRRSKRRRRTVSAYRDGDKVVVLIPASMSRKQEAEWVTTMVARLERSEKRKRPSDEQLAQPGAGALRRLPRGSREARHRPLGLQPERPLGVVHPRRQVDPAVRRGCRGCRRGWSTTSWSTSSRTCSRHGHTREFWAWVDNYPKAERAKGYLQGYSSAAHLEPPPGSEDEEPDADDVD